MPSNIEEEIVDFRRSLDRWTKAGRNMGVAFIILFALFVSVSLYEYYYVQEYWGQVAGVLLGVVFLVSVGLVIHLNLLIGKKVKTIKSLQETVRSLKESAPKKHEVA